MTTRETNAAIAEFRELRRHEAHVELHRRRLEKMVVSEKVDIHEYHERTRLIDEAVEALVERDDLAPATMKSYLSMALNQGKDKS